MLRSVDTWGGLTTNVTSECHSVALDVSLSTASTFVVPGTAGTVGCAAVSSPNQDATRSWPASSSSTPSKTITLCSLSAPRRAAITSLVGSAARSTPSTTAPMRLVSLRTDSDMTGTSAVAWGSGLGGCAYQAGSAAPALVAAQRDEGWTTEGKAEARSRQRAAGQSML